MRLRRQRDFVQNGYIRASERKLATNSNNIFKQPSTLLEPIPSMRTADVAPMPAGQFVQVAIPLYYEGHVYRAGTRIRVTIAAPNGAQPVWAFSQTVPTGTSNVSIAFSRTMPSSLVCPSFPVSPCGAGQPPCGACATSRAGLRADRQQLADATHVADRFGKLQTVRSMSGDGQVDAVLLERQRP